MASDVFPTLFHMVLEPTVLSAVVFQNDPVGKKSLILEHLAFQRQKFFPCGIYTLVEHLD